MLKRVQVTNRRAMQNGNHSEVIFLFPWGPFLVLEVHGFQSMSLADGKALSASLSISSSLSGPLV